MKLVLKTFVAAILVVGFTSCGSKEQEKKIAELESKLDQLSPGNAANPTATPVKKEEKPEGPLPVFAFDGIEHDFGTINEGDVVEHTFKFTNNGESPLIIQNATGSCGCTVPTWSKEPVPVGGEGVITAKFNSKGKPNVQNKTVTITANTWPKQTKLTIKALVTPAPAAADASGDGPVK